MATVTSARPARLTVEWATASRAKPGEEHTGDSSCVVPFAEGTVIGVIDGLGHGKEAAASAEIACREITEHPADDVLALVRRCHSALIGARGVALTAATIDARRGRLTWIGVGNVEGVAVQIGPSGQTTRTRLINRGGVVGSALPQLRAEVLPLFPGDVLVFATDGIDQRFADDLIRDLRNPQDLANGLLTRYARINDDALILVARLRTDE